MSVTYVTGGTLGDLVVALPLAISLINPLLIQYDAQLTGPFGVGTLLAELQAELAATLAGTIGIGFQNPLEPLYQLQASVQAGISAVLAGNFGLPTIEVSAQFAAMATLEAKIQGLTLLLDLGLSLKIPIVQFIADIQAALGAGPFGMWTFSGPCHGVANELQALLSAGISSPPMEGSQILPDEGIFGILILTKNPTAYAALGPLFSVG
jgi:hypothetical protein